MITINKVVNPCSVMVYRDVYKEERPYPAFAKVLYDGKRLSITGVVGPRNNGDCWGSAGQCVDSIKNGIVNAPDWDSEMLKKFCEIWEHHHLNDMRPYCPHQKELGWDKLAHKDVEIYHYRLTTDGLNKRNKAESAAIKALHSGETFTPSEEQVFYSNLPYSLDVYKKELEDKYKGLYAPKKPIYPGDTGYIEHKKLGWLHPEEHPDGILTKPCPVCGYKYGTSWLTEEVPEDVLSWLSELPETKKTPAWV